MPGYTGHIKGLISENLFAQSYGNSTSKAIGKKHPIGHNVIPKERFRSQNTNQYRSKNFRRFADKPFMEPRKDYDDYTRFINDTYVEEKTDMLNNTCNFEEKRNSFVTKNYNPLMTLRTYSELEARPMTMLNRKGATTTKNSRVSMNPVERRMGSTFTDFDVRPKILESKISQRDDFFNLSDGFKKIFAADKKD